MEQSPPLSVLAITINRKVTREEYGLFAQFIDPKAKERAEKLVDRSDAFRYILAKLIPTLLMWKRHPGIPPSQWPFNVTRSGKDYIDSPNGTKVLGYDTAWGDSLVAMAYAHGPKSQVVNIGIDVMQLVLPKGVSARKYLEAFAHKLTRNEEALLDSKLGGEVLLRRLCILLTLKSAYTKALGQPAGFDFSRIDCNIPEETILVDGKPLKGWEFRLFKANLGVVRKGLLLEETYQCSCAVYRGLEETRFIWEENLQEMEKWLCFITADMVLDDLQGTSSSSSGSSSVSASASASASSPSTASTSNAYLEVPKVSYGGGTR